MKGSTVKRIYLKAPSGRSYVTTDPVEAAHLRRTRGYVVTTTHTPDGDESKAAQAPANKAAHTPANKAATK